MTLSTMKKIISALNSASIKAYDAITDTAPTHFYNNDTCFNIIDEGEETIYNFGSRISITEPFDTPVVVRSSDLADIHEIRFGGDLKQIEDFVKAYGLDMTDEQYKILLNINSTNNKLNPSYQDYLLSDFKVLSESEYEKLGKEDKAKYDEKFALYSERELQAKRPVSVRVG